MNAPLALPTVDEAPATGRTPLIQLRDVTKTFYRGKTPIDVLHGISLDIHPGEFVALMGVSGSGKSTLMNLIGLLDRPSSGSYRFAGEEVSELAPDRRALLRLEAFGFVFQQYNLLANDTAIQNVEMPAIYAGVGREARQKRAIELLTQLGLEDRLDHRPNQLSGGQQQRVSIGRALMNGGAVILADEPTGALDSRSGAEVMKLLADLNAFGHTIILITHEAEVARHAHRIIEIRDGLIVSDAPTSAAGAPKVAAKQPTQQRSARVSAADIWEAARMAAHALRSNLLRSLLTLLGIIIGVASVIAMLAIGNGARQSVLDSMTALGTNLMLIRPGAPNVRPSSGIVATLTAEDAEAINELPNIVGATPEYFAQVTVRFRNRDYSTLAIGTNSTLPQVRSWPVDAGVFVSDGDVQDYAPVAVLGRTVAKAVFPLDMPAVGNVVLVNNIPFQVVGTLTPKGATPYGWDMDDLMFVPITTATLRLFGQRYVHRITVKVADLSKIDDTQQAIKELLIRRHRVEDFQIRNMTSIIQTATEAHTTMTILLGSIAAISLLVGGIGVMNIMLVSVTERTREIGVRMATGARRAHIMLQFNTEALAICTFGGILGVLIGLGATWAFAYFGRPVLLSAEPVLLAFACAFATGLLFGYLPARKAANLDPVAALATE
ncbi:MAG: MacB family efflux pump subunit [Alphaproteobacteria bacterium]|nr:MacB family efflux pump subunit [Alphaproteobacteria bacterium]